MIWSSAEKIIRGTARSMGIEIIENSCTIEYEI